MTNVNEALIISQEELDEVQAAVERCETDVSRPSPLKSATRKHRILNDGLSACVTLDVREWLALLRPWPAGLRSHKVLMARNAIAKKCEGMTGDLTIAGSVEGFTALVSELEKLREVAGIGLAYASAAKLIPQLSASNGRGN